MAIPTLYDFRRALQHPASLLEGLGTLRTVQFGGGNLNRCTSRFAESEVVWHDTHWLLCMPLRPEALPPVERIVGRLRSMRSPWLTDYRLLRGALRYTDSTGIAHRCDLVLQQLPAGLWFDEALHTLAASRLHAALDALQEELRRLGLSHRNLKPGNLRWSDGRLLPVRWHYAVAEPGLDDAAFAALRLTVDRSAPSAPAPSTAAAPAPHPGHMDAAYRRDRYTGHLWVGNLFEQRVCVCDPTGYGYVDTENRPVIASRFLWADDFHEGRAAVQTATGMGLIDKEGRYVVAPHYEIVEYDVRSGSTAVRDGGQWYRLDYLGRQIGGPAPTWDALPAPSSPLCPAPARAGGRMAHDTHENTKPTKPKISNYGNS